MASVIYNSFKRDIANGSIDLDSDDIYALLVTSDYSPDQDAHTKRSDITNEISGTGYLAGGKQLEGATVVADNEDNEGAFDANDLTWTGASFTARGAVLYKKRGGAASADELIAYIDFGSNQSVNNGTFSLVWNAEGIININ